jgi:hypothetical protein
MDRGFREERADYSRRSTAGPFRALLLCNATENFSPFGEVLLKLSDKKDRITLHRTKKAHKARGQKRLTAW